MRARKKKSMIQATKMYLIDLQLEVYRSKDGD